jgi:hypothetical protein
MVIEPNIIFTFIHPTPGFRTARYLLPKPNLCVIYAEIPKAKMGSTTDCSYIKLQNICLYKESELDIIEGDKCLKGRRYKHNHRSFILSVTVYLPSEVKINKIPSITPSSKRGI